MKFFLNLGIRCLIIIAALFQIGCEENCKKTLFELNQIATQARTLDAAGTGNALWLNSAGLPIDRLLVKMELSKPVQVFFTANPACPVVFENSNPVDKLVLTSSTDFDLEYPAGTDLSDIIAFTDLRTFMSKDQFVADILNGSNLDNYYFSFSKRPMEANTHTLILEATLADGKKIRNSPISVKLVP